MKFLISLLLFGLSFAASADPCFHAGSYEGRGFAWDDKGKEYPYSITVNLQDSSQGSMTFTWQGADKTIGFRVAGTDIFIDGSNTATGKAACGRGAQNFEITFDGGSVREEWVFTGNYLMIHGQKEYQGQSIVYQELLVRE
jgi:hypothetical protein